MKIYTESTLSGFKAWSGAVDTQTELLEKGLESEFENLIDDCYPDGLSETELNDLLWFERDWIFESLGIEEEEEY